MLNINTDNSEPRESRTLINLNPDVSVRKLCNMYGKGLKTANEWGKETNIEILYKQEFQEANEGKNNKN